MIVVLDTNVVLQALNQRHPYAPILRAWHAGRYHWAVSTEILFEYEEIIRRQSGPVRWAAFSRLLDLASAHTGTLRHIAPTFFFRTISADRDDDKFADCAITAHADYIITSDAHFRPLIGSGYKPQPLTPEAFLSHPLLAGA